MFINNSTSDEFLKSLLYREGDSLFNNLKVFLRRVDLFLRETKWIDSQTIFVRLTDQRKIIRIFEGADINPELNQLVSKVKEAVKSDEDKQMREAEEALKKRTFDNQYQENLKLIKSHAKELNFYEGHSHYLIDLIKVASKTEHTEEDKKHIHNQSAPDLKKKIEKLHESIGIIQSLKKIGIQPPTLNNLMTDAAYNYFYLSTDYKDLNEEEKRSLDLTPDEAHYIKASLINRDKERLDHWMQNASHPEKIHEIAKSVQAKIKAALNLDEKILKLKALVEKYVDLDCMPNYSQGRDKPSYLKSTLENESITRTILELYNECSHSYQKLNTIKKFQSITTEMLYSYASRHNIEAVDPKKLQEIIDCIKANPLPSIPNWKHLDFSSLKVVRLAYLANRSLCRESRLELVKWSPKEYLSEITRLKVFIERLAQYRKMGFASISCKKESNWEWFAKDAFEEKQTNLYLQQIVLDKSTSWFRKFYSFLKDGFNNGYLKPDESFTKDQNTILSTKIVAQESDEQNMLRILGEWENQIEDLSLLEKNALTALLRIKFKLSATLTNAESDKKGLIEFIKAFVDLDKLKILYASGGKGLNFDESEYLQVIIDLLYERPTYQPLKGDSTTQSIPLNMTENPHLRKSAMNDSLFIANLFIFVSENCAKNSNYSLNGLRTYFKSS